MPGDTFKAHRVHVTYVAVGNPNIQTTAYRRFDQLPLVFNSEEMLLLPGASKVICRAVAYLVVFGHISFSQQSTREASISEFPKLPKTVSEDLRLRGCTVPQPPSSRDLANVIRGHFRDPQEMDWAILCDIRSADTSLLLVYWSGKPSAPTVVRRSKLPNDNCWTDIAPGGAAFIMKHYWAYAGSKPPPIDHEGIKVGICEKASTVSYFYRNRWLTLTGSD